MAKRAISIRPPPVGERPKNKLLASPPKADFDRLGPHLRTVPTNIKRTFHRVNEPVHEVFFPNGGVASMTAVMANGAMVEIATIGDEGFVGANALFGGGMAAFETMMQVPERDAEAMSIDVSTRNVFGAALSSSVFSAIPKGCSC
jgi:hypothetical protein